MNRMALTGAFLVAALAGGCAHCGHNHGGRLIQEYKPGGEAEVTKTPYAGTFVLFHSPKPPCDPPPQTWIPDHQVVEMFVRGLGKRQAIGFECKDGKLFAVAGDEKIELAMGRYCWHLHPNSEYTGMRWLIHETGERIVEIVSMPFGLAALILCLPFILVFFLFFFPFVFLFPFLMFSAM